MKKGSDSMNKEKVVLYRVVKHLPWPSQGHGRLESFWSLRTLAPGEGSYKLPEVQFEAPRTVLLQGVC